MSKQRLREGSVLSNQPDGQKWSRDVNTGQSDPKPVCGVENSVGQELGVGRRFTNVECHSVRRIL